MSPGDSARKKQIPDSLGMTILLPLLTSDENRGVAGSTLLCQSVRRSGVIGDDECVCVLRVDRVGLLDHFHDAGGSRTIFQSETEIGELLGRADRVGFHAAVAQVPHVAADLQALRAAFREVAEADALHESGYEKS